MTTLAKIRDFDDPAYDPYTAAERFGAAGGDGDAMAELARLRNDAPVHELDLRVHLGSPPDIGLIGKRKFTVLSYEAVTEALGDAGRFSNSIYEHSIGHAFGESITVMDPPRHRDYRVLFQKAFTPAMISGWADTIVPESIARSLDRIVGNGRADIQKEFALLFPFTFIFELLQLPEEDRAIFQKLAFAQTTERFDRKHAHEAGQKLRDYLYSLVAYRRDNPIGENDFITTLAEAEVDGQALPEEILVSFLRQLLNAGGDTSYHGFSTVIAALLRHPDQLEAVKADRTLLPAAIDEAMRWEPPILYIDRTPAKEIEFGGFVMKPGDHLAVALGAANRDGAVFNDPDTFDIFRKQKRSFTFGYGPHVCIGQHLARLELRTAFNLVFDRLKNLRLDPDYPVPHVHGVMTRKPKAVHVLWDV